MAHFLKLYLVVTGFGATLAVFFPGLVVAGFYLFILPGLILSLMPAAFLWGMVFAILWFPLHYWLGSWVATVAALPATFALFWVLAAPGHALGVARLAGIVRPDVTPTRPIVIAGDVRIDRQFVKLRPVDSADRMSQRFVVCDSLCAAALFTPGVTSVTLHPFTREDKPDGYIFGSEPLATTARTFRLVPRSECRETPQTLDVADADKALAAEWTIKLSTTHCVVAEPALSRHDMHIAFGAYQLFGNREQGPWSLDATPVGIEQLDVRRGNGELLLRETVTVTQVLVRPLMPWGAGGGGGDLSTFRFGWSRAAHSNKRRSAQIKAIALLRANTNLRLVADPSVAARRARDRLAAMIADPSVDSADLGWSSAAAYFAGLAIDGVGDVDRRLLLALIGDSRMTRFDGLGHAIRALGDDAKLLRDPIVKRFANLHPDANPRDRDATKALSNALHSLPAGTFSTPTPIELAVLADPTARSRASGLVRRQADRGGASVPLLVEIVEYHSRAWALPRTDQKTRTYIDDDTIAADSARVALCRLGPIAHDALPRLMTLYRSGTLAAFKSTNREWTLTLARLGEPVESFAKPDNLSGTTAQYHRTLQDRLAKFQVERDCRSSFI